MDFSDPSPQGGAGRGYKSSKIFYVTGRRVAARIPVIRVAFSHGLQGAFAPETLGESRTPFHACIARPWHPRSRGGFDGQAGQAGQGGQGRYAGLAHSRLWLAGITRSG